MRSEPRHAFEQHVPAREEARQHAVHHRAMADHGLGDLAAHLREVLAEADGGGFDGGDRFGG
jgi:hypothetical protein